MGGAGIAVAARGRITSISRISLLPEVADA